MTLRPAGLIKQLSEDDYHPPTHKTTNNQGASTEKSTEANNHTGGMTLPRKKHDTLPGTTNHTMQEPGIKPGHSAIVQHAPPPVIEHRNMPSNNPIYGQPTDDDRLKTAMIPTMNLPEHQTIGNYKENIPQLPGNGLLK